MSAIFLLPLYLTYWPKRLSRDAHLAVTVSTKFELDTTIRCLVIALLLLIRHMPLSPSPLTLVSGHTWRVTWWTPLPSLKILRLSVLELRVLRSPIGYHWQERASHFDARFQGEGVVPLPIYWHHLKGNWIRYNFAADSFYKWNFAVDFSSFIVKVVQKMTIMGILIPILRKLEMA